LNRSLIANKRALEIAKKDPDVWENWMSKEQKAKLSEHTENVDHRTFNEWRKSHAESEGLPYSEKDDYKLNPYIAAGRASRGEFDMVRGNWSIGGKKTSLVGPDGTLYVYEHGDQIEPKK